MHTVGIGVVPHLIADDDALKQAGIDRRICLAGNYCDEIGTASRVGIRIGTGGGAAGRNKWVGERITGRRAYDHTVGAGPQIGERVVAVRIGGRRGNSRSGGVEDSSIDTVHEAHGRAGNPVFADGLNPVAVVIVPHAIADGGGREKTGIEGGVGLVRRERDARRHPCRWVDV